MTVSVPLLTVGITTRNRPADLLRCVTSVAGVAEAVEEILIVDDDSSIPVEPALRAGLPTDFPVRIRVIRFVRPDGYIVARNRIARESKTPYILYLDDDAFLFGPEAVRAGLAVVEENAQVAAVAFAQAEADGRAWPLQMQPSVAAVPSQVPTYIGFAHLVRRETFLTLGGYRECFHFYAEENEYCLRLLDAGYRVIYLPDERVAHLTSPIGRDSRKWLRFNTRNALLTAFFTLPLLILPIQLIWQSLRYFRARRRNHLSDPWGYAWVIKEVFKLLPEVARTRRSVRYSTYKKWQELRRTPVPYLGRSD